MPSLSHSNAFLLYEPRHWGVGLDGSVGLPSTLLLGQLPDLCVLGCRYQFCTSALDLCKQTQVTEEERSDKSGYGVGY